MKIKMICTLLYMNLEKKVNRFLEENKEKVEVIDIKWKFFLEHYAMIIYKEKFQWQDDMTEYKPDERQIPQISPGS